MSNMARSDEIDELVSSVRNLVSYKDGDVARKMPPPGRLILTPALRIDVPQDNTADAAAPTTSADLLVLYNAVTPETSRLGDTVAELEVAVTARAEDWEPDGGEPFDQAAWAASAFDLPQDDPVSAAPEAAIAETLSQIAQSGLDARIAADIAAQNPALPIDEDALRAAVVRILREELAGELGEKITRNVRKLVWREINRVLVVCDLD
ncbi:MAG: hypothetical protein IKE14_04790 [Loktanella sp.]|nr:hypothetical protein [Loktanella sp.]